MIDDSRFGNAPLPLQEGKTVVIGMRLGEAAPSLGDLVMWEATFPGVGSVGRLGYAKAIDSEAHASIGGGSLQAFATSLTLVREGDAIRISGVMEFRVRDIYKFEDGHWLHYDEFRHAGMAKDFVVVSTPWLRRVSGVIHLDGDNVISAAMWIVGEPALRARYPGGTIQPRMMPAFQ